MEMNYIWLALAFTAIVPFKKHCAMGGSVYNGVKQGPWPQVVHKVEGAGIDRIYCWLDLEVL